MNRGRPFLWLARPQSVTLMEIRETLEMAYGSLDSKLGIVRVLMLAGALPAVLVSCGGDGSGGGTRRGEGGASGAAGNSSSASGSGAAGYLSGASGSGAAGYLSGAGGSGAESSEPSGGSGNAGEGGTGQPHAHAAGAPPEGGAHSGGSSGGASAQAGTPSTPAEGGQGGNAGDVTQGGTTGTGAAHTGGAGNDTPTGGAPPGCTEVEPAVDQVDGVEVSTLTGSGDSGATDGSLSEALFDNPVNTAVSGNLVFVADFENGAIRVIDLIDGAVDTLYADAQPPFCRPFGLAVGDANELFVATDCGPVTHGNPSATDGSIWRFDTEEPDTPELILEVNGRSRALLYLPPSADHEDGRLMFSDLSGHTVQVLDLASGSVSVLAGSQGNAGFEDGQGSAARLYRPYGLALLDGDIIVADDGNHALRRVTLDGAVTTIAGTGCPGLVDGPAESAMFTKPQDVAVDDAGHVFISDGGNHRMRVLYDGVVRTLAGGPEMSFADGSGADARFYGQEGFDATPDGLSLFIADGSGGDSIPYNRIRLLDVPPLD